MDRIYQIRHESIIFDNTNIKGLIKLSQQSNTQTNLTLGSCAAADLVFEVQDLDMELPSIEGKEFLYSASLISPYEFLDGTILTFRNNDIYCFMDNVQNFGYFTADKPERINDTRWKITMYDRMKRFDKSADGFLCENKTIGQIMTDLCAFCNVPYIPSAFPNDNFLVGRNFTAENLTCRDVLKWIGEAAARFFVINENGYIEMRFYTDTDTVIGNDNTFTLKVTDYCTDAIDKVQVKITENDIGVIVGTGDNCYSIIDNPLLYATSDAQLRPVVTNIYNEINGFQYTPVEASLVREDIDVRVGDIVTVNSYRENGLRSAVMSTVKTPGKIEIKSTGDKRLSKIGSVNRTIKRLEGKTSEIVNTIDEFSVTLSDMDREVAQLKITNQEISTQVTKLNTDMSSAQSSITQNANAIETKVSTTDYNGNKIASLINQSATTVAISASKINLTGYITAKNLSTSGETVINGSNITTGVINANRIQTGTLNGWSLTKYGSTYPSLVAGNALKLELVAGDVPEIRFHETSMYHNEFYDSNKGTSRYGLAIDGPLLLADYRSDQTRLVIANPATASSGSDVVFVQRSDLGGYSLGRVTSSARYKSDIKNIEDKDAFEIICALCPKTFRFMDEKELSFGLIAEDVAKVAKMLTCFDGDKPESVQYKMIGVYCIGAIKYLAKRIEEMEKANGAKNLKTK